VQGACTTQAESLSVRSVSRESTDPVDGEWRTPSYGTGLRLCAAAAFGSCREGGEVLLGF